MTQKLLHRVLWAFVLTLGSASCGFTPVYATGSKTMAALSDIIVAPPEASQASYIFVQEIESRIGRNLDGSKTLEHNLQIYEQGFETIANHIRMIGLINYKVISTVDEKILFSGTVQNFTSFTPNDNFATSARQDAQEGLISILADQMTTELIGRLSSLEGE